MATNPRALRGDAVSLTEAWDLYDTLLSDPRVAFAQEPADLEPAWRSYTDSQSFSSKVWNDAYLAAFAQAASLALVTFDRGFAQYPNVPCTILS